MAAVPKLDVLICGGASCISNHSHDIKDKIFEELKKNGLENDVRVIETGCMGPCELGPVMLVYPDKVFYQRLKPSDIETIVKDHFIKGRPVEEKVLVSEMTRAIIEKKQQDTDFFKKQTKIVLSNCGRIDPENIEEYIAENGYEALGTVLTSSSPDEVVDTIKKSGLRGRGGGGFPTGKKWEFVKNAVNDQKYVVCNADEGDPGAFMDRSVLEGDPHCIIEGMSIAAYTVGANKGYVYIRAEYPLAIKRLEHAIEEAREYGFLGENIFETDFSFDLEIRIGAGAFVCGEETALIASIEGGRGNPRPRPPFPAISGLWGKPTLLNNVETYANIRHIILKGWEWYSSIGTETSKGTKVFALSGKIKNTGLIEVPMGTTLRELIFDIGGGVPDGKKFKAVQLGGPSGGCVPEEYLDTPIDYETLIELGAMMGSGGVIVMDEDTCMVNTARFFLDFTKSESCGKCVPCRVGLVQLHAMLDKIVKGEGELEDLDKLERLCHSVKKTSLCGLGQTAPNPVLSTLRYFKKEYLEHIQDHKCRAGVCSGLVTYTIIADACKSCGICAKNCPVDCISGEKGVPYVINQDVCISCGTCYDVCPFDAITKS